MTEIVNCIDTITSNHWYIIPSFLIVVIVKILNISQIIKSIRFVFSKKIAFPDRGEFGCNLLSENIENQYIRKGKYSICTIIKKGQVRIKIISLDKKHWHFRPSELGNWNYELFNDEEYTQEFSANKIGKFDMGLLFDSGKVKIEIYEDSLQDPTYIRSFQIVE
jgi:hypothetical protein